MPQCLWKNCRITEVGRHLWSSPIPATRINAEAARVRYTDCAQLRFEYLQGCSTNSLGNLCSTTTSVKRILLFRWNSLCFDLCPLPLVLSLGTTEKNPPPSSLHHPIRYICTSVMSPQSLSSSRAVLTQKQMSYCSVEVFLKSRWLRIFDGQFWIWFCCFYLSNCNKFLFSSERKCLLRKNIYYKIYYFTGKKNINRQSAGCPNAKHQFITGSYSVAYPIFWDWSVCYQWV